MDIVEILLLLGLVGCIVGDLIQEHMQKRKFEELKKEVEELKRDLRDEQIRREMKDN